MAKKAITIENTIQELGEAEVGPRITTLMDHLRSFTPPRSVFHALTRPDEARWFYEYLVDKGLTCLHDWSDPHRFVVSRDPRDFTIKSSGFGEFHGKFDSEQLFEGIYSYYLKNDERMEWQDWLEAYFPTTIAYPGDTHNPDGHLYLIVSSYL